MNSLVIVGALALSFGSVAPALAVPARSAAAISVDADATPTSTSHAETRRYCLVGTITGSRLAKKECRTRADWLKEGFDPIAK